MTLSAFTKIERFPLKEPFTISRLTFTDSLIATVKLKDEQGNVGFGECEPHEWDEAVGHEMLKSVGLKSGAWTKPAWAKSGLSRESLNTRLSRSPIRNAIDCALWDLESKQNGVRANTFTDMKWDPVTVMPTIGIKKPAEMAKTAKSFGKINFVKVKLGGSDGLDAERMEAVSNALPGVSLLIDVNTGWTPEVLLWMLPVARRCNVKIIEQPLLPEFNTSMPKPEGDIVFCADESCLDRSSLEGIEPYFQFINIKLDKTGGLTEALALREEAERLGMGVMVGMMSGTSLAIAPAHLLAQGLEVVDLELGFLKQDRQPAMRIEGDQIFPPKPKMWG